MNRPLVEQGISLLFFSPDREPVHRLALVMIYTHLRLSCVHRPPMSRFSEFRCSVGDWKLTKMAACNHFSFSKVCGDYFDGFS